MNAGARLALYGAGLVVAFGASFGVAHLVVPEGFAAEWMQGGGTHGGSTDDGHSDERQDDHDEEERR